jgi:hypothetical protein
MNSELPIDAGKSGIMRKYFPFLQDEEHLGVFATVPTFLIDPSVDACCDARFYFEVFKKNGHYIGLTFDWTD